MNTYEQYVNQPNIEIRENCYPSKTHLNENTVSLDLFLIKGSQDTYTFKQKYNQIMTIK